MYLLALHILLMIHDTNARARRLGDNRVTFKVAQAKEEDVGLVDFTGVLGFTDHFLYELPLHIFADVDLFDGSTDGIDMGKLVDQICSTGNGSILRLYNNNPL